MAVRPIITELAICSGAGMLSEGVRLGLEYFGIGHRTVCHIERDRYAAATLVARMEEASLDQALIWDCVETFDCEPWRGRIDCVTAGFPCQPWSHAGTRAGTEDERWIWPDIARIIRDTEPSVVFLENVPGLVSGGGLHHLLDDLAESGFDAEWLHLSASAVGAAHRRDRVFILAYSRRQPGVLDELVDASGVRTAAKEQLRRDGGTEQADTNLAVAAGPQGSGSAEPDGRGLAVARSGDWGIFAPGPGADWRAIPEYLWPAVEPGFRVLVDGLAVVLDKSRADQLRVAGNGVVPLQAAAALVALITNLHRTFLHTSIT